MSRDNLTRPELLQALTAQSRRLSTRTVLFHQMIAERLGLHTTDHKCLDILNEHGQVTAGQLADLTGLTTGAITAAIDRLEKARLAKREFDPSDRRKVIIKILPDRMPEIRKLFETSLKEPLQKVLSRYTHEQLTIILDYITDLIEMHEKSMQNLKRKRRINMSLLNTKHRERQ
jgi:DNA-binding MarR family transcriptional regulator